jgi:dUTP pyrophosphatase
MAFKPVSAVTWSKFFDSPPEGVYPSSIPSIEEIQQFLPRRSTTKSAGYDFFMPYDIVSRPNTTIYIPTGFKWDPSDSDIIAIRKPWTVTRNRSTITHVSRQMTYRIPFQVFLALYPRSSYGMKYGFRLLNTTGIIDADYYNNEDNEGHIIVAFTTDKELSLKQGDKFCQGIIQPYLISAEEIAPNAVRSGGMGSTDTNLDKS